MQKANDFNEGKASCTSWNGLNSQQNAINSQDKTPDVEMKEQPATLLAPINEMKRESGQEANLRIEKNYPLDYKADPDQTKTEDPYRDQEMSTHHEE